jgi:flagellar motor switch protein FliG
MADPVEDVVEENGEVATSSPQVDMHGAVAAAILLLLLDEDEAAAILRELAPEEVKSLGKAMFDSSEASEAEVESALDRFVERSRVISALSVGAEPRIRGVITQALGNVRADNILAAIAPQSSEACLDALRWMEAPVISRILSEEHPQVSALILAVLNPDVAAKALDGLEDSLQGDLLYRAARLKSVNADAISDLETLLCRYTEVKGASPKMKLGGKSDIAKIVNAMPKPNGERVLKSVKKLDRVIGQEIEDEMFIFENLGDLDSKSLGAILRSVDTEVLTLALKGASKALVDKALGSMSARAAQGIRDDMADRGPTKRAEVDEAQRAVILAARKLAADGAIMLGGGGEDYV